MAGYALSWAGGMDRRTVGGGGMAMAVVHSEGLELGWDPDRSGQEGEHSVRTYACTFSPLCPPSLS